MTVVIVRVLGAYRSARNCGTVAMPLLRYRGRKKSAITTSDSPASTSQAITERPSAKAAPFRPTSCSVERLVSSSEPAM